MNKENVLKALKTVRDSSKERKFNQSVDLSINLKNVNLKDPSKRFNDVVILPKGRGKSVKICVVADGDAAVQAKGKADHIIKKSDISSLDKNKSKKLAAEYDYFLVQAPLMGQFASIAGQVLGPKGKMPLPSHILPPVGDPKVVIERTRNSVRVKLKDQPVIHVLIGTEEMSDNDIAENIITVYKHIKGKLEKGDANIKNSFIKFTMSKAVKIE